MTDRDRPSSPEPELSRPEGDEGAMTGATGSLTPDSATDEFVPAERREISDPAHLRDVTVTHQSDEEAAAKIEPEPRPRPKPPSGDGDDFSDEPDRF